MSKQKLDFNLYDRLAYLMSFQTSRKSTRNQYDVLITLLVMENTKE